MSDPTEGSLRFRDINTDFSKRKLIELKDKEILTEEQYNQLESEWKSAFTLKGKYYFEQIWLIEHTDIIKKKRLFF